MTLESIAGTAMEPSERGGENAAPASRRESNGWGVGVCSRKDSATACSSSTKGPTIQGRLTLRPIMSSLQAAPLQWSERAFPRRRQKAFILFGLCLAWSLAFVVLSDRSISPIKVDGVYQPVQQLSCTDSFWLPNHGCGINGEKCASTGGSVAIHCPADCASVKLQKPYFVGPQTVVDQPLIIGGPIYRADSWICPAAVHADILSNTRGGCAILSRMGQTNSYPGSHWKDIASVGVKTYFPQSFRFQLESDFDCQIKDQRWLLPYVSVAFTATIFLFGSTAGVPFFTAMGVGFAYVSSSLYDSDNASRHTSFHLAHPLARIVIKYLPAIACSVVVYRQSFRRIAYKLMAPAEKTILWLGAFWTALLFGDALFEQAIVVPCMVAATACHQMYYLRQEGTLARYRAAYALFLTSTALLGVIPLFPASLLILAVLLLPGASVQTRPNLAYQGLLAGLLVYGLVKHNPFASANQFRGLTPTKLSEFAAIVPPAVDDPEIHVFNSGSNITFHWQTPVPTEVDGISMLVNDVEKSRHMFGNGDTGKFEYDRTPQAVPDYVRFSWVKDDQLLGYGDAGVWEVEGAWSGLGAAAKN